MQWVCEICRYVHDDGELPDVCPVCGAPKSKFAEWPLNKPNPLINEVESDDNDEFTNDLYSDFEE